MNLNGLTNGTHFNVAEINKNMGEKLVMHALMTYWDWDVEYVNYVGADLIAIDMHSDNMQKYAISVKTKDLTRESQSISAFTDKDFEYLCSFASDMSKSNESPMVPLIAFVALTKTGHLYILFVNAYDFNDMREENIIVHQSAKGGYSFNIGTKIAKNGKSTIENVLADERISYIDMEINSIQKRNLLYKKKDNHNPASLKYENWCNELGDFGEKLVVFLANTKNRRAYHIQSVGADIIMLDMLDKEKQYAISVKTIMAKENDEYQFSAKDVNNLTAFANKWNMKAELALVTIITNQNGDIDKMYYFLIPLQYMTQYIDQHLFSGYIRPRQEAQGNAYCISWKDEFFKLITNDPSIDFIEIKF